MDTFRPTGPPDEWRRRDERERSGRGPHGQERRAGQDGSRYGTRWCAAARRAEALFKEMGSDFLLREQFVTDPAQIVAEYVQGERLEPRRAEDTNRLVHSVMSNPGLVRWIRDVARRPRHERADPDAVLVHFGRAVVDNGASHVVTALFADGIAVPDAAVMDVIADSGIFELGCDDCYLHPSVNPPHERDWRSAAWRR